MRLGDEMFLNMIFFILVGITIYLTLEKFREEKMLKKINDYIEKKNEKYYRNFLSDYEKHKKVKILQKYNLVYKLNVLIEKAAIKRNIFVNPAMIILYGFGIGILVYVIAFEFFRVISLAVIVALPSIIIPIVFLEWIANYKSEQLEKTFLNFLVQLKNYAQISNDISSALRQVKTVEPLQSYLEKFNVEINSGIKFETAIEHLKEKISVKKFKEFFSSVQYCYIYGGNYTALIDRNYKIISDLQSEKERRKQETQSARLVLYILMFLNLFVYVTYIKNNYENYMIMQRSFLGMAILYWNFISMWFLIFLAEGVKKLDY